MKPLDTLVEIGHSGVGTLDEVIHGQVRYYANKTDYQPVELESWYRVFMKIRSLLWSKDTNIPVRLSNYTIADIRLSGGWKMDVAGPAKTLFVEAKNDEQTLQIYCCMYDLRAQSHASFADFDVKVYASHPDTIDVFLTTLRVIL